MNLERFDEAGSALDRARALSPESPAVWRMLGRSALETDHPGEATARLAEAVRLEPRHELGRYFYAFAAWRAAGDSAAVAILRAAAADGLSFRETFREDSTRWEGAGDAVRFALRGGGLPR